MRKTVTVLTLLFLVSSSANAWFNIRGGIRRHANNTLTGKNTFKSSFTVLSNGKDIIFSTGTTEGHNRALYIKGTNGNVGLGTANPSSKFDIFNGTITISTNTGSYGIRFQNESFQSTAHSPVAISSEPSHSPDVASLTYVGVATVTYTNAYSRFTQCGYVFSVNNGSGAARTYTAVIAIDGVLDADHEHAQKNSGNGDSLHVDTHYVVMSAGEHTCSAWVKTNNAASTQVAENAHVDVVRH